MAHRQHLRNPFLTENECGMIHHPHRFRRWMISKDDWIRCHPSVQFEFFLGGDFFNASISEEGMKAHRAREERDRFIEDQL